MRKVDFDTATVKQEELDKMNREQLLLTASIFHTMESDLWDFANEHKAFDDPSWKERTQSVQAVIDTITATYIANFPEDCFVWRFSGCLEDFHSDVSHYDIEKDIAKNLGTDGITMDSESSWFFVQTTDARKDELEKFLKKEWEFLEFSVEPEDKDDLRIPGLGCWGTSKNRVKEAGIKVTIALPELSAKPEVEIEDLINQARTTLMQTGLSRVEAAERLLTELGVGVKPYKTGLQLLD